MMYEEQIYSKLQEIAVQMDALYRMYGEQCPPGLAQALRGAKDRVDHAYHVAEFAVSLKQQQPRSKGE